MVKPIFLKLIFIILKMVQLRISHISAPPEITDCPNGNECATNIVNTVCEAEKCVPPRKLY